jgi:hypothetical protein
MLRSSPTGDFDERKPAMFRHSPGPWQATECDEPDERQVVDAKLQVIADVYGVRLKASDPGFEQDQLNGDAALLGSALAMYTLLREIATYMHDTGVSDDPLADKIAILLNNIEEP